MTLLNKIHVGTKYLHTETETKPFLKRYGNNTVTLMDHYRHLCQMAAIYAVIEDKLKQCDVSFSLSGDFNELLNRSEKIEADLVFLERFIPTQFKRPVVLQTTKNYIINLELLNFPQDVNAILGHFLVRILGDLFGGQHLKQYVQHLYAKNQIEVGPGVQFYEFSDGMLKRFTQEWLKYPPEFVNEEEVVMCANDSFKWHCDLFDELEATRAGVASAMQRDRLFSIGKIVAPAVVTAAVAAAWMMRG